MAKINYEITLDLVLNKYVVIRTKQQDINTRRAIISCTMNGEKYVLSSGISANIVMKKPDGYIVANPCQVDMARNVIIADLTEQMLAVNGNGYAEIVLINVNTNEVISTMPFVIIIAESAHTDTQLVSSDEFKSLGQLALTMEEIRKSLEGLDTSVIDAEKQRQQNEAARASAENTRNTAEQQRISAENTRKTAETQRDNAEKLRVSAEQQRGVNDATYASQERGRVSAEQTRAASEQMRVSGESQRVTAEKARASAESTRVATETKRGQDEQARKTAESTRAQQEDARKTAEQSRVNIEKQRVTAEQTRATKEQQRDTAEQGRVSAESTRNTDEQGRVAAEKARVNAENQRVEAEKIRVANQNRRLTFENVKGENSVNFNIGIEQVVQPKLYGKSTQITTKGYQLFDASKLPTTSKEGVTLTNHGDGSFTISGSGNMANIFSVIYEYPKEEALKLLKVGTLKLNSLSKTRPYFIFGLANVNGAVVNKYLSNNPDASIKQCDIIQNDIEKIKTGEYKLKLWFFSSINSAIAPGTIKPMVYYDGDGTWEPFAGGKPSPSPEYPQKIISNVVEKIEVTGSNLINIPNQYKTNGWFGLDITNIIQKNTEYFCQVNLQNSNDKSIQFQLRIDYTLNGVKNYAFGNVVNSGISKAQFKLTNFDSVQIVVKPITTNPQTLDMTDFMLSMFDIPYEPYKGTNITLSKPIELRGIKSEQGNVTINGTKYISDVLCVKNGVIGVERNVDEVILSGNENWKDYFISNEKTKRYTCIPLAQNASRTNLVGLCDRFMKIEDRVDEVGFFFNTTNNNFNIKTNFPSLTEFSKWIRSNSIKVTYTVETPTVESLPQADQDKLKTLLAPQGDASLFANAFIDLNHIATPDYALPYPIYSELEVDAKLNDKANTNHTHTSLISKAMAGMAQNEVITVPLVPYSAIDPTHIDETYLKEWLKWVCANYPKVTGRIFIGAAAPNATGIIIARIYNTNEINSEGYPRYANFVYYPLPSAVSDFITGGFNNYIWSISTYNLSSLAIKGHHHVDTDIDSIGASKIKGKISLDNLPHGALERCVVVKDDAARFALTTGQVQVGDTVKVTDTGRMYFVTDDTKLSSEAGYEVYTAGAASSVPWSGITNKPATFTPSAHKHEISDVNGLDTALASKATTSQGAKADTAVQSIKLGGVEKKVGTVVELPAYPTTLPASDVSAWAKAPSKPTYTAQEIGALPSTTKIPTALAELTDDVSHRFVTDTEKQAWNAKSNFSGNYNDLLGLPTLVTEARVNELIDAKLPRSAEGVRY